MNFETTRNLIGRILISAIFIYAIPGKLINFERTVEVISNKNIPPTLASFFINFSHNMPNFWLNTIYRRI